MYEGKNIHFSALDKKPLCSFSAKVCNQHRLNGYGFCVRHILEDPTAPFKRCAYVAKSSKQTCTQAIPQHENREYCNNHMQVLGMLPRKERKPKKEKEKPVETVIPVAREKKKLFEDRVKSRFHTSKLMNNDFLGRDTGFGEDPDDPYAFPDPSGDAKSGGNVGTMPLPSMSPYSEAPLSVGSQGSHGSKSPGDGGGGGVSSIAKLYPELAEKLEKIKPKFDTGAKMKDKGKVKSSRTMNRLQTKIAQNKIKDKLKKNQESNSQSQSPCHGFGSIGNIAQLTNNCNHYDAEMAERMLPNNYDSVKSVGSRDSSLPNTPVTELKRPPVPYCMMQSSPQDVISNTKYPGSSMGFPAVPQGIPHGMPLESLPGMPNASSRSQQFTNPDPVRMNTFPSPGMTGKSVTPTSLPLNSPQAHLVQQQPVMSIANSPMDTHKLNYPLQQHFYQTVQTPHPPLPPPPYTRSVTEMNSKQVSSLPAVSTPCTVTPSATVTPAMSSQPHPNLPPPPPYRSKSKVPSTKKTRTSIHTPLSSAVVPNLPPSAVTQPYKIKHALKDEDWPKWMKMESSKNYYNCYQKRKKFNHSLIGIGLKSSDEDSSESEDENFLPWQPVWFTASSDDEAMEEEDQDDAIRTTKLALLRAQARRQCLQSRRSYRSNTSEHKINNGSTMALIQAAREAPRATVAVIQRMLHQHQKLVNGLSNSGPSKKKCCYKDHEDVQCKNTVLPLTNHCLKHIMYNVDQQMFDYCTAKFADNTQCCMPVFDVRHELPLCMEHAVKADNYSKEQEGDPKQKRPRKKTKPSALTRPPKKGKKKKNQRKQLRPQKPSPPSNPIGLSEMPPLSSAGTESQAEVTSDNADSQPIATSTSSQPEETKEVVKAQEESPTLPKPAAKPTAISVAAPPSSVPGTKESVTPKSSLGELPENVLDTLNAVSADMDKALELPLEQASRLLEEKDFQEVFNKLPDEAFDIFTGKNGDYEPTNEEVEELERHLAAANMDVKNAQKTLDSFSLSNVDLDLDEEQLRQITATLFGSGSNSEMNSGNVSGAMCNGQDQENINAIARSLSASEVLMTRTSNAANIQPTGANSNVYQSQPASVYTQVPGNTVNGSLQTVTSVAGGTNVIMATQSHVVHSNMETNVGMAPVTPINTTAVQIQPQYHAQENYVTNHVLSGQQFPQQSQQHPSMPLHQLVSAANVTGIPNVSSVSIANHISAESIQGNLTNKTHMLSNQIPSSVRVAWPLNLGQITNYQNGYPVHNAFVQGGGDAANLKFHNVNAQHVNHSSHGNMNQELTNQQYQLLTHSAGSPNSVMVRAPLQTFTNSTQRPGFSQARLPPPFSATNGKGS